MKKNILQIVLLLAIAFMPVKQISAQEGIRYISNGPVPEVKIYSSGKVENIYIEAQNRMKSGAKPLSTFEVEYIDFSDEAKVAFGRAVELWSYLVSSKVPIKINATWTSLATGVLGSCGPATFYRNFPNAPKTNTWYPVALANKIAGYDLDTGIGDINARFNKDFTWYLGTDGICPRTKFDFVSVVLHELGHGLGFIGSADVVDANGSWGSGTEFPFIFDQFAYNGSDQLLINTGLFANPSPELKTQYTSGNVYFHSELSDIASEGHAKLYTPSTWNSGSSYSHLDEIYNNTSNTLMTYSSGYGEVTHHPGDITLGMFAEMGWVNILFNHSQLKDIEPPSNPTFEVEILGDSAIVEGSIYLHYSTDNFTTDNKVSLTTLNDTLFSAQIPITYEGKVNYYFEATNSLNRKYFHPVQQTEAITNTFSFSIGADVTPPIIKHQPESFTLASASTYPLTLNAFDNLGLDSIYVEYKINEEASKKIKCTFTGDYDPFNYQIYNVTLPLGEGLSDGDIINYKIVAVDLSSNRNTSTLPLSDWFKVKIYNFLDPAQDITINFDGEDDASLFILSGFTIGQPSGFSSKALHSPHPYEEGQNFPSDEISYTTLLRVPIILKNEDSWIRFDEIVIVEPGDRGTSYGDQRFWDYVILEGSKDMGETWDAIANGYDCSINKTFKTAFSENQNGSESMYKSNMINLLGSTKFSGGDEILIRFRLWSDQASVGWGWAIDNIEIQGSVSSVPDANVPANQISIFPNPSSNGLFNIYLTSEVNISQLSVAAYNVSGSQVYLQQYEGFDRQQINLDLSHLPSGIYFIKVKTSTETRTERIVIR